MDLQHSPLAPDVWVNDLFTSKAAQRGEVIRRKARDVERFAGMAFFLNEVRRRGFQVVENSGQLVIFCNQAPIKRLTPAPAAPISSKEIGPKSFKDFGSTQRPAQLGTRYREG
ncbi:MAG: aspartate aminotransferase [Pseudomonadota bacterium]